MRTIVVDPRISGATEAKLLAALVDAGASYERLQELAGIIEAKAVRNRLAINLVEVERGGIRAKALSVSVSGEGSSPSAEEFRAILAKIAEDAGLSAKAREYSLRVFDDLVSALSRVYGTTSLQLLEPYPAKALLFIAGAAALLDEIGAFSEGVEVYTTPPALGGGFKVVPGPGLVPVPHPLTLEILSIHGYAFSSAPVKSQLTTPLGAALLANLTSTVVEFYPPLALERVGYGAGPEDYGRVPNVLRVVVGQTRKAVRDKIVVLETNLDDVTGEVLGYLVGRLMEEGALDVSIIPATGKKNRPVHIVKVLCRPGDYARLVDVLMEETGTLGVRVLEVPRIVAARSKEVVKLSIQGRTYYIRVKTSKTPYGKVVNVKPEYEDLKRVAKELGIPLRRVAEIVEHELREKGYKSY